MPARPFAPLSGAERHVEPRRSNYVPFQRWSSFQGTGALWDLEGPNGEGKNNNPALITIAVQTLAATALLPREEADRGQIR